MVSAAVAAFRNLKLDLARASPPRLAIIDRYFETADSRMSKTIARSLPGTVEICWSKGPVCRRPLSCRVEPLSVFPAFPGPLREL